MDKEVVIKEQVKSGLSEYGLNETERRDFENVINDTIKDTEFESEEKLTEKVKDLVSNFVPSAKILQKNRTKLMQENAELTKQLLELKNHKGEEEKDEEPKETPDNDTPAWAKGIMEELSALKAEREAEKQEKKINERKDYILATIKPKYNKSFHSTIDVISKAFDFSKEDAELEFKEQLASLVKDNPTMLAKNEDNEKESISTDLKVLADAMEKQATADKTKAEALKNRFK